MNPNIDFVQLIIFRGAQNRARWVRALRTTANHYGWLDHFPLWSPGKAYVENGVQYYYAQRLPGRGAPRGSKPRRICRAKSSHGHPARLTNQFQISNSCRTIDLAELAYFTKGDWHWMEDLSGKRLSRDHWHRLYLAGGDRRRAGLVSV
jgi:hypothetical protein